METLIFYSLPDIPGEIFLFQPAVELSLEEATYWLVRARQLLPKYRFWLVKPRLPWLGEIACDHVSLAWERVIMQTAPELSPMEVLDVTIEAMGNTNLY